MICLSGSHRVGKTTLAKAYALKFDIPFVETSASAVFKSMGLDPAVTYDFSTRLTVQEEILKVFEAIYAKYAAKEAITDRSPLDLLGYTLAEAIGHTVLLEDQERLSRYTAKCFEVLNKRFSTVIVLQPGIPVVYEEGKAAINNGYIEHLNSLIIGLSVDERMKTAHFYIPRALTNLVDRIGAVNYAVSKARKRAWDEFNLGDEIRH